MEEANQEVPNELVEMAQRYARYKEREAEDRRAGNGGK
jgi:hypothetical protein